MSTNKVNLIGLNKSQLENFFFSINEPSYRAQQLHKWVHQKGCLTFQDITDFSKDLRNKLDEVALLKTPDIVDFKISKDKTIKYLLKLGSGSIIEMVRIPDVNRVTLCISSQVGCALQCTFCATGAQGFEANLDAHEIISQIWLANFYQKGYRPVTNVVFMGMGEPLLNFIPVTNSIDLMLDQNAYGLSKRKITLSTSGIAPEIIKFGETTDISLAVSLHAPNDNLRDILVPVNKKYPLKILIEACKSYLKNQHKKKTITVEYIMIRDVNDQFDHVKELCKILSNISCKVNLIPFNSFEGCEYKQSTEEQIKLFKDYLIDKGFITTIRVTRGDEVDGACGQLAGHLINGIKSKKKNAIKVNVIK